MAKKQVNLSVGRGEKLPVSIDRFVFIEPEDYYLGKENQVYCEFTKSGKHYIYAHFEKDTNNLFYIGLGKFNRCNQISQRNKFWKYVKRKHGLIIKFLEINLTPEEAIEKEKYYIKKYQPKTNITIGGEIGNVLNYRVKVYAYLKTGEFYKSFNSITEANIFLNTKENDSRINRCLTGERKSFANLIWSKECFERVAPYKKPKIYNQKEVYRYDLDGNFIEKYEKITDFKYGHTGICNTLDKNYTYYNSFWRSTYSEKIETVKVIPALKPAKMVINTETGEIFKSTGAAAKILNCCRSVLERKLNGTRRNNTKMIYYE